MSDWDQGTGTQKAGRSEGRRKRKSKGTRRLRAGEAALAPARASSRSPPVGAARRDPAGGARTGESAGCARTDRQTDRAGRARRGRAEPVPGGKEEPGGLREGEGSGGAGRARGAGRKRGGAAGRGPPEKRPNFLPRQSQEAGAGTQGPGSPSPTSGVPPVTSLRGHQVHRRWPRPASSPWLPGEVGRRREGAGALRQRRGLLRAPRNQRPPSWGLSFSICQRGQRAHEDLSSAHWVGMKAVSWAQGSQLFRT